MGKHLRFADQEELACTVEEPLLIHRTPSQLPTPFQAVASTPSLPSAGGVFRDKHGRYRTLYDQRARTTVLVNFAGILERSNEQTLPALYKYVGRSFDASPRQLGFVTLSCALTQAIAAPAGGLLGHYYNRVHILSLGCFIWAAMAVGFAFCNSVATGIFFWAFNGVGLALLIPNAQSLIADYFKSVSRGKAFGAFYLTGALGGMAGALYATNMGHIHTLGLEGWRIAFISVAFLSAVVGCLNLFFSVDPRYRAESPEYTQDPDIFKQRPISFNRMWSDVLSVLAVPSFILIVVQGVVGSAPWNALVWNTLYLQLLGFSDFHSSLIASLFLLGTAAGALIGGVAGDIAAERSVNHGRVLVAQFSVLSGVPMSAVVYKLLPASSGPGMLQLYGAAFFIYGCLISWAAPAANSTIFSEIVPSQQRTIIYSFDRAFEGAIASMGAPIVGWLAERMGFSMHDSGPSPDLESAAALGDAMLMCTAIPWAISGLLYSGLHITYRRDRVAAQAYQRARSGFFSVATLPIIEDEEKEEEESDAQAALAAMGSRRMPLPPSPPPPPPPPHEAYQQVGIARLGRGCSRSV